MSPAHERTPSINAVRNAAAEIMDYSEKAMRLYAEHKDAFDLLDRAFFDEELVEISLCLRAVTDRRPSLGRLEFLAGSAETLREVAEELARERQEQPAMAGEGGAA